jgi:ribosomal protein L11 methyltransferase
MAAHLTVSFDLGPLDPERVDEVCRACGASAITYRDAQDDPVLEPAPGEIRLWPATRVQALFARAGDAQELTQELGRALGLDPAALSAEPLPERRWEREWLRDFHALRFGRRLWVRPRHERVRQRGAVVVTLEPGLAFGTGTHPSTALCLQWLDAQLHAGACVIDYGCGSGVLALAAAKLGAGIVHCFDIDPQALTATGDNARANRLGGRVRIHAAERQLPANADLLLANILSGPLLALAPRFATLVRPGGQLVLAGLMRHEAAEVTGAYAACFDVAAFGERDGWICLAGRRRSR